ncbi:MAG: hypothetical protein R3298_08420 [Gammaproteobacteria bacterium]|nr:hypothetical protein [Gammaproteobacteria bacterium]
MITYADTVAERRAADRGRADDKDHEPDYGQILQTLQTCPLGQDDDARHLTRSVILGEN